MKSGGIIINREYQRTDQVWPPAARAYLIDTILLGYPMPKLCLSQKTDLKSRKTIKEIVDGQQRSKAILDFFDDNLRITGKSQFSGKSFSQLDESEQKRFIEYSITTDIFVGATEDDIRQVFRRMNSYTVPLNPQEHRHATHQGEFKWFIVDLTEKYAGALKKIGVFSEKQLSRMADAALFTEIVMAMVVGIETASRRKLDTFYQSHEEKFREEKEVVRRIDEAMAYVLAWEILHNGILMRPYNFYSLVPAISHCIKPLDALNQVFSAKPQRNLKEEIVLANLGQLSAALDQNNEKGPFAPFVRACSSATNTKNHREIRFQWISRALQPELFA